MHRSLSELCPIEMIASMSIRKDADLVFFCNHPLAAHSLACYFVLDNLLLSTRCRRCCKQARQQTAHHLRAIVGEASTHGPGGLGSGGSCGSGGQRQESGRGGSRGLTPSSCARPTSAPAAELSIPDHSRV